MKTRALLTAASSLFLLILSTSPSLALANRVFVSARSGNDLNNCANILTPCQTLAGAVLELNPGGEAIVLDSGGYGPVTVTQSLTIEAPPGVLAFIHPPSGDAVTINAGGSDRVILRGLVLNGGSGNGITVNTVGLLHVENCVISGFTGEGIRGNAANSELFIKDTISRENLDNGMYFTNGRASVDHCRVEANGFHGVSVDGADVSVRDSVFAGNFDAGLAVDSFASENSILNVYQSTSTNNGTNGFSTLRAGTGVVFARVANSSMSENSGYGLVANPGVTFETLGNNFVRGNLISDLFGTPTLVSGQ